jgi:phosphate transport system substrate-binding protein
LANTPPAALTLRVNLVKAILIDAWPLEGNATMTPKCCALLMATVCLFFAGCGPADTVTIQGCGATFPAPLYERWFLEFYLKHPKVRVNYQAIGSGAGIQQFTEGLVHFGASDEALNEERLGDIAKTLSAREGKTVEVMQIPMTAGAVALCHNLPGEPPLRLSRKALADILLGHLSYWDDPRIQSANPGITLPHMEIIFIRRAEGSGTTFVFTNHINAIDQRWDKKKGGPGAGKTIQWPVNFIGGKGNAGVAALVQQTPGALGYLEAGYAEITGMPMAALENHAGNFVQPDFKHCQEALEDAEKYRLFNKVLGATIADPKGAHAYPIVTFTWVICRKSYPDPRVADNLKAVLSYCLESKTAGAGQELSQQLGYVPLPEATLTKSRQLVAEIHVE